jgi:hypothetical protein
MDGSVLEVWADGVQGLDGAGPNLVFDCLMDVEPVDQQQVDINCRTPSNPKRVCVVVAKLPRAIVREVRSN